MASAIAIESYRRDAHADARCFQPIAINRRGKIMPAQMREPIKLAGDELRPPAAGDKESTPRWLSYVKTS